MTTRLTLTLSLALCTAFAVGAYAQTASEPVPEQAAPAKAPLFTGSVTAIDGLRVEVAVEGDKPTWVKKGAGIKLADIKGGLGKIVDVSATGLAFNTKKAGELKVGDRVTMQKGTVVPAGC